MSGRGASSLNSGKCVGFVGEASPWFAKTLPASLICINSGAASRPSLHLRHSACGVSALGQFVADFQRMASQEGVDRQPFGAGSLHFSHRQCASAAGNTQFAVGQ